MASSMDISITDQYKSIQIRLFSVGGAILFSFGIIGNLLNCIIFIKRTMRQNPSSIYFTAVACINLLVLVSVLLPIIILYASNSHFTTQTILRCKVGYYVATTFLMLSRYYLVLTAIDRVLITSSNALVRQLSTRRLAYRSIAGVTLFILLYHIYLLAIIRIVQLSPGYDICFTDSDFFTSYIFYSNLIIGFLIPLLISALLTIVTLKNIRRARIRPMNGISVVTSVRRGKDRQFIGMGLSEIVVYIIFNSPTPIRNVYQEICASRGESAEEQAFDLFLQNVFYIIVFIIPAMNFYIYLIVSKAYRKKVIRLFDEF
ncbi:unnamed protein product [Adineta ricciae]|uniref:G-protein coupled receptors family 1 profile domain-containing protein n=1 Tax=Adineta ricciae TaxID=249248 RepID=A0A814XQM6_ADIRI|nr:unnamed protein product [Adineta ricciae]CAF1219102.1 unnamed protein product [Adineta ricciae]